jgi:hypothetical protein
LNAPLRILSAETSMHIPTGGNVRWPAAIVICLAVAACGPRPNFSPYETYANGESAIYGYVSDLYACGLSEASVRLEGSSDTSATNASGQYRFRVRAGERYSLTASSTGFSVDTVTLFVGSDPLRHDFSLVPVPDCPDGNCRAYRPPCRQERF